MELSLDPSDEAYFNRCADRGAKTDFLMLLNRMASKKWDMPGALELGIWRIGCGENVVYCFLAKLAGSSETGAVAYSISLVRPRKANGCAPISSADALLEAREIRDGIRQWPKRRRP